jgi:hypothetical protein
MSDDPTKTTATAGLTGKAPAGRARPAPGGTTAVMGSGDRDPAAQLAGSGDRDPAAQLAGSGDRLPGEEDI